MHLLTSREKSGLIINNPEQTVFLFVDKYVKQVIIVKSRIHFVKKKI